MKKIFFIFLIFVPTILFAQATRRVTDRATNETYHVLRSDRNIRHGEYQKFDSKRTLLVSGQYKLGERDGFWMHFAHLGREVADMRFAYLGPDLVGVYCYTDDVVIYRNPKFFHDTTQKYRVIVDGNAVSTTLCSPPVFLGGETEMLKHIANTIRYPAQAREAGISGIIIVFFTVDKFGNASNHRVAPSLGYGLDEAAIDAYKTLPNTWSPGILNGEPVDVVVGFPARFTMGR